MVAFGIQQLMTAAFVRLVPPLPAWIPGHSFWAYLTGILLILAGVAIGTEQKARWAAAVLGPLFLAGFLILGGIQHFVYADFVMKLVPSWIPSPRFWVYLTGIALIAGGIGLLLPKTQRLAATLVGIMILLWVVLLHIPRALADLHDASETSGVFEALAMSGAAFILADRGRALQQARPYEKRF
jgi:uncharacterized membrane protein